MPVYQPRVTFRRPGSGRDFTIDFSTGVLSSNLERYGNNFHNVRVLAVLWVSLLADSPTDSVNKPSHVIYRFALQLTDDMIGLTKRYSSLYDLLTTSVKRSESGVTLDTFIEEFKDTPIFREYLEFYKTKDALLFKFISTFLLFGKKSYFEDETFNEAAFRGWLEVEERLGQLDFDSPCVSDLAVITGWIFRHFDDELFLPKHGNGAVAEAGIRGITKKNSIVTPDPILTELFHRDDVNCGDDMLTSTGASEMAKRRVSRLKFVPKDIGKARSICMEPATLMWTQQGVRLWIEQALAASIGRHIPLHDQERNCELARRGSEGFGVDTIDLSSASDSVHYGLIEAIMPDTVLKYLSGTRSNTVLVDEETEVKMHKFAPMGSALCFPIQSAVYAAVVLYSSLAWQFGIAAGDAIEIHPKLMYHYYEMCYVDRGKTRLRPFSIYGDDIICDSRITNHVIETLKILGFAVNVSKSFTGTSAFRESCGGFYLDGEDVTPLRAKFKKIGDTIPISTLAGLIDLANRARVYGYRSLWSATVRTCLYYPIAGVKVDPSSHSECNPILFTTEEDAAFAICTPVPRNEHLRQRYYSVDDVHRDTRYTLQRDEYRSICPRPIGVEELSSGDDDYLHCVWWRSRLLADVDVDAFSSRKIPSKTGPGWRWTNHLGD